MTTIDLPSQSRAPRSRRIAWLAALALFGGIAQGADLHRSAPPTAGPFTPTVPLGFASEFPRSPLADAVVNGQFRYPTARAARVHCPHDTVVRVEPWSNVYHPARTPGEGSFMCLAEAEAEGDRPR